MNDLRNKVLADVASLRQHKADLNVSETRLKFYESKSEWLQKRVKDGFSDSAELWDIGQKLQEERATSERPRTLASSVRYQLASYAGEQWQVLLGYLEGKRELAQR